MLANTDRSGSAPTSTPARRPALAPIEELVREHASLVRAMARPYAHGGVSIDDLEQEGALGLIDAAERFDPTQGASFKTYARYWIRHRMQRFMHSNRAIVALPQTRALRKVERRLRKATRAIEARTGRAASNAELAEAIGVEPEDVALVRADYGQRTSELRPERETRPAWGDDDASRDPEGLASRFELRRQAERLVRSVLERLDDRERFILAERRLSDDPSSLRELGERLEISSERVRQLEKRAFKKMRAGFAERGELQAAQHAALALAS